MLSSLGEAKSKTLKQVVIEKLQDYIVNNQLKPGDPLPTEQELAATLKVSRNIVREALQDFRSHGIIETRPKTGARIKQLLPENPFGKFMPFIESNKKSLKKLAEMRLIIDAGMVPLLIENISDQNVAGLRNIAEAMKDADFKELRDLDRDFHTELMQICKNDILMSLQPLIVEFFEELATETAGKKDVFDPQRVSEEHLEIVEALDKRDREQLLSLMLKASSHYLDIKG